MTADFWGGRRGQEQGRPASVEEKVEQPRHSPDIPGPVSTSPVTSDAEGAWGQQPAASPWLRWLRPRGSGRRSSGHSTPNAMLPRPVVNGEEFVGRHDFDNLEDRLLALFAGMHGQVASDHHESDRLAELSASRLEAQVGMAEKQQQRLERRFSELTTFLQSLDEEQHAQGRRVGLANDMLTSFQASRAQCELEWQRRLVDLEQDQRVLANASNAAAARDEEAQRHHVNRLRAIEERLAAMEDEQRRSEEMSLQPSPGSMLKSDFEWEALPRSRENAGSSASSALRKLEASFMEETRVIHDRCNHMQQIVDNHVIQPMQKLDRHVERLSASDRETVSSSQAQDARLSFTDSRLEVHEHQLINMREWLERLACENHTSKDCSPAPSGCQQPSTAASNELDSSNNWLRTPTVATTDWGSVKDLGTPTLERIGDLEDRWHQNASAVSRLQEFMQRSMDDIKRSIDHAVRARCDCCELASDGLSGRVGALETDAQSLGRAFCELRHDLSDLGEEVGGRRAADEVETRDSLERLERFEEMVSEIQVHVVELGRHMEESLTSPPQPLPLGISESESIPLSGLDPGVKLQYWTTDLDPGPHAECSGTEAVSWMQADALLRSVEQVVGRQHRELARLTNNLNLQCLHEGDAGCDKRTVSVHQEVPAAALPKPEALPNQTIELSPASPLTEAAVSPPLMDRRPRPTEFADLPRVAQAAVGSLSAQLFSRVDANQDGVIDRAELQKAFADGVLVNTMQAAPFAKDIVAPSLSMSTEDVPGDAASEDEASSNGFTSCPSGEFETPERGDGLADAGQVTECPQSPSSGSSPALQSRGLANLAELVVSPVDVSKDCAKPPQSDAAERGEDPRSQALVAVAIEQTAGRL